MAGVLHQPVLRGPLKVAHCSPRTRIAEGQSVAIVPQAFLFVSREDAVRQTLRDGLFPAPFEGPGDVIFTGESGFRHLGQALAQGARIELAYRCGPLGQRCHFHQAAVMGVVAIRVLPTQEARVLAAIGAIRHVRFPLLDCFPAPGPHAHRATFWTVTWLPTSQLAPVLASLPARTSRRGLVAHCGGCGGFSPLFPTANASRVAAVQSLPPDRNGHRGHWRRRLHLVADPSP